VIGAVNVSAPAFRFGAQLDAAAPVVARAAAAVGASIGLAAA
jgi:DNA-binding IclR family transcriptional regulator